MRVRMNGGVIGPTNPANSSIASGVYSIVEAQLDKQSNNFPQYIFPAEPQFYTNALLLHGDGSNGANNNVFLDSSSNALSINRNGTPTQGSFSPFNLNGWSNLFNGSTDALTVAGSSAFAFGTGDFTIEFWMRSTSSATQMNILWMTSSWAIIVYSNSQIYYQSVQGSTNVIAGVAYGSLMDGNWHHVALVRASGQSRFFIDGSPIGVATADTNNYTATNTVNIANVGAYGWYNGSLSNLRIVKGTALYNLSNTFTPATSPLTNISGTSLLTCQSNRFIDNSTNAYTLTGVGTPTVQAYQPFAPTNAYGVSSVGGSLYFSGTSDYLSTSVSSNAFTFGTGDWTVEFYTYPLAFGNMGLFQSSTTSNGLAASQTGTGGIQIYFTSSATIGVETGDVWRNTGTTTLLKYSWNHIALVKSSGNVKLYINGVADSGFGTVADTTNYTATYVSVGGYYSTSFLCNAYISNLRVLKGSAQYTTNFTPPSSPLTAIANTSFLLNGTNAGVFDTTGKNNLFTGTTAGLSTTQAKFGGSSMKFDGTANSVIYAVPSTSTLSPVHRPGDYGTSDFTIECWVWANSAGGFQVFATNRNSAGGAGTWWFGLYTGTMTPVFYDAGTAVVNGTALTTQTWTHVAVSRAGTSLKMFVNGAAGGTTPTAVNSTNFNASGLISIGYSIVESGYGLTGYIDDLRISRYARYTAAFTAPTAAFMNQ